MSRARQVANFDPALFAADEVSGDKVSGGTISGSPTLVTPDIGTPSAGVVTNLSGVLPVGVTGGTGLTAIAGVTTGSGNVTITDGNLILDSGHGIDFSDTANSSGSSITELLDDYETGHWTPSLTASSIGSVSYTWRTGTYTKIGRQVCCVGYVQLTGSGNTVGSGTLQVTGFPFTAFSQSGYEAGGGVVMWHNVFANNAPQVMNMGTGSTTASCYRYADDVAIDGADISSMNNSGQFAFTVNYRSSS